MSKKQEEEQLNRLVDFIKRGKINDVTHMLESDKQKKLQKLTDDVRFNKYSFVVPLILSAVMYIAWMECITLCMPT